MNETEKINRIIELLHKDGIIVTEDNIKIWNVDVMSLKDVKIGCDYIKQTDIPNVLVYINTVPNRPDIQNNEDVVIIDSEILKRMALKHKFYDVYDFCR